MSARKFLFSAVALAGLIAAGAAQAQVSGRCSDVLEISDWISYDSRNGYYSNVVYIRNLTHGMVSVGAWYTGAGAIPVTPVTVGPFGATEREIARTPQFVPTETLKAGTGVSCNIVG